jgi:mannose-6-phosphate isomerase-like protein (cupin superfamily)
MGGRAGKLAAAGGAVLAFLAVQALGQGGKTVAHVSSKDGKWVDGPVPGVKLISLQGDMTKGAYSTFTRFVPGADHGWHTHTNDVTLVVSQGAYLYKGMDGKEIRVGTGQYLFIPGGNKHWSGGDAKEGCTFYQHSTGSFDLNQVEGPAKK